MKKIAPSLALGALCIFLIEVTQLLTGCGSCDIDDFILNFTGFALTRLAVQPLRPKLDRAETEGGENC